MSESEVTAGVSIILRRRRSCRYMDWPQNRWKCTFRVSFDTVRSVLIGNLGSIFKRTEARVRLLSRGPMAVSPTDSFFSPPPTASGESTSHQMSESADSPEHHHGPPGHSQSLKEARDPPLESPPITDRRAASVDRSGDVPLGLATSLVGSNLFSPLL